MREKWKLCSLLAVLCLWTLPSTNAVLPRVDSITPSCGSLNGGTRITIYGTDFARSYFNFMAGNKTVGSSVQLVAMTTHDCEIHPDGSHETQIMCYTTEMPAGTYDVRVSVDGVPVDTDRYCRYASKCKFKTATSCTPTITSITPYSGMPGQFIEICGNIITSKYGSFQPDEFEDVILRVYFGGQTCELRDTDNDELYGITIDGDRGCMKCLSQGTFIGNVPISFLISNAYGRSLPDPDVIHVRSKGIGMYQSYTEISHLSQNSGSTAGGTLLTVHGRHFDDTVSDPKVMIAGEECEIVKPFTDTEIVCRTPRDASVGISHFTGGRGMIYYTHFGVRDLADFTYEDSNVTTVDQSVIDDEDDDVFAEKVEAYFVPAWSGMYSFNLNMEGTGTLYISNGSDPAHMTRYTSSDGEISLEKGEAYYMEVSRTGDSDDRYLYLKARTANTDLSEEDTGMAEHEVQDIRFTSKITQEIIGLSVNASGSTAMIQEDEQVLTIYGNPLAYFAIGLDGSYTEPLPFTSSLTDVEVGNQLQDLPNIEFDVSVYLQHNGTHMMVAITSRAPQGEINNFTGMVVNGRQDDLIFIHERLAMGKPEVETFTLTLDGIPTTPITVGASAAEVQEAIESLFTSHCHPTLHEGVIIDFEDNESWMYNQRVSDTEPFCGRYSIRNSRYIYHKGTTTGISVSTFKNKMMCLAYKGEGGINYVKVLFEYLNDEIEEKTKSVYFKVNNDKPESWNYHCADIYDLIDNAVTGTRFRVSYAQFARIDYSKDTFVDHVTFIRETALDEDFFDTIVKMRRPAVLPNSYSMNSVVVTETSSMNYEIELSPFDCGHDLPMFEVAGGTQTGDVYDISNGGTVSINITRLQTASPPIGGNFTLSFMNESSPQPIPVTVRIDSENIIDNLATMKIGYTEVSGWGTCSAFTYRVKMVSLTGDQPLMEIEPSSQLTGTNVQASVSKIKDGGLWLSPIMGDLLRTHHKKPQVIVYINNIPTRCSSPTACTYEWDAALTPNVTDISPNSGSHGDTVSITGTGFDDSDPSNNEVIIGTTPCTVTAATRTSITCTINNGPTGEANVNVFVDGKGLAETTATFTYVTGVDSFTPSPGSVQGGSVLTIDGFGFTSDANVTLDGRECAILNINESQITCKTPPAASEGGIQTEDVVITQGGSSITAGQFTYNPSTPYTPIITAISATSSPVWGGDSITIDGNGFGSVEMPVTLGGKLMNVTSYSDTEVVAVLPALPHGSYKIYVDVEDYGYADLRTNSISDITYTFQVNSMTPDSGSLYGGTDLIIAGVGFSTDSSILDVYVGNNTCDIMEDSLSSTQIKCRIADTGTKHMIDASGIHKHYGRGYAWDKDPHTVYVGDYVTWTWSTPFYVSGITYGVHQTFGAADIENMDGGFSSGENTRKGSFTHRFIKVGAYFYWSGFMDEEGVVYFRGTIYVMPLMSHAEVLSVQMYGHEASYNTGGSPVTDTPFCPASSTELSGCTDSALTTDATKFNFQFLKCQSPYIDSISLTEGTTNDVISISGDGFGNLGCHNEILYDGSACEVQLQNSTYVDFKILPDDSPPIAESHMFELRVANWGYALTTITDTRDHYFELTPYIQNLTPSEGSKVGGTMVTITGSGFVGGADNVYVDFQYMAATVEFANYTHIICETHCSAAPDSCYLGSMTPRVFIGSIEAECENVTCNFTSTEELTASVDFISPDTVSSASTNINITGTGFGTDVNDLVVEIGGEQCIIEDVSMDTFINCTVGRLPVGENKINVYVLNNGKAATTLTVLSEDIAVIGSPPESSIYGGAELTLYGNGFVDGETTVTVGGLECPVKDTNFEQVICTLPAQAEGEHMVVATSKGVQYQELLLNYSTAATPDVTGITPSEGQSGNNIIISGTGFKPSSTSPEVMIGDVECTVVTSTDTAIECEVNPQQTGTYDVQVFVPERGYSNNDETFTYELGAFSVNPGSGTNNGGQVITLGGSGFLENHTDVTICGETCTEKTVSNSEYICVTPKAPNMTDTIVCDIVVTVGEVTETNTDSYTYDPSLISTISSVSPSRGGTGGGTLITITGTNFGSIMSDITVTIAGVACTVGAVSDTEIQCKTGEAKSVDALVSVQRSGRGEAVQTDASFEYIDVWSSPYTWGGDSPPVEGDFVIIPKGQKILLDVDTEVLSMLLIQGGEMIFDEADIELQAENILLTDGGTLQVGSADAPFPSDKKAIITMHGHLRSKELPIYGTKTLAVREGTLNLYGNPTNLTWTRLAATAEANTKSLLLEKPVDWKAGDEVVIATTGDRHSQKESEVHTIDAVSDDGRILNLTTPLAYEHIGISATFGSRTVDFRAEVGLLSRNILVRGYRNIEFDEEVEACPDGFNTGEFATQTCFQGRFGEELGSDQFGAQIMIHQGEKDTQAAQAHLEYVELTHVGQAFRLGRYPIHFHLNGNMSESYVRGCAIHTSFNRAVNIHGSHNVLVEHNVIYNIKGGAYFLEDGDETGNTFQYNLAIFVHASTSLRNDDITPAAFWVTNPNNFIRHNAVAGGTHFGTWYRMHVHPDGPGHDTSICPRGIPLGEYRNNSAHAQGWFGIWIFEVYSPRENPCSTTSDHKVAIFHSLFAWNCEKGAEGVNLGAVQFRNFTLVNNLKAGYEGKLLVDNPPQFDSENGPGIFDSLIVAHHDDKLRGGRTKGGVVLPYNPGFLIENTEFVNFNESGLTAIKWTRIDGTCLVFCGGFQTETSGLVFTNSPHRVAFDWESEGVLLDRDGSLTDRVGKSVAACSDSFDPVKCTNDDRMDGGSADGCICDSDVKLVRFSFNNISPSSLDHKRAKFQNKFGSTFAPWAKKRISHPFGWSVLIAANEYYTFTFEDADHLTNITYDGTFYNFASDDFIVFTVVAEQQPDLFALNGVDHFDMKKDMLIGSNVSYGDWYYNSTDTSLTYAGCEAPKDPIDIIEEPLNKQRWSQASTWTGITHDDLEPKEGDDVVIPRDKWIILDKQIPALGGLIVEGGLQFDSTATDELVLDVDHIYITGKVVIGFSDEDPFLGKAKILLRGDHSTSAYEIDDGPNLGAKFIGVFGGLVMHGKDKGIIKTYLASTVLPGMDSITVKDDVTWEVNDDILITTTSYSAWQTEVFRISAIRGRDITLNETIKYRHISHTENVTGQLIELSASVAVLTRNIKIEGKEYPEMESESFGARIIVGQTVYNDLPYSVEVRTVTLASNPFDKENKQGFPYSQESGDDLPEGSDDENLSDDDEEEFELRPVHEDDDDDEATIDESTASDGSSDGESSESTTIRFWNWSKTDLPPQDRPANKLTQKEAALTAKTPLTMFFLCFAQVSNVEFYHTSQEGYTVNYDARFSLTYSGVTSTPGKTRYSYVKKNAFHSGFNTAVGIFSVDDLEVDGNIIYHTVGPSIRFESQGAIITNNLIALSIWPGSYQNRQENPNFVHDGAIHGLMSTDSVIRNNIVSGSERVGYRLEGQACGTATEDLWSNNMAHSCLQGVLIFASDSPPDSSCALYHGFLLWKNLDFGFYYNNAPSVVFRNNIVAENGVSFFPFVFGPSATDHKFEDKTVTIEDNIIIGKTSTFNETEDVIDLTDDNILLSATIARSEGASSVCGKIGITFGTFSSGGNAAPTMPFTDISAYQAIKGLTKVVGNTFVKFKSCTGGYDHAIATNDGNEDVIHPAEFKRSILIETDKESKVYYHRPDLKRVNPSDCVDMDCDAKRKVLITDVDGTFFGSPGTALPNAGFEWDGDPRHGVGDYRIPLAMLTTHGGDKIDVNSFAPNKGIFKADNCSWIEEWNAFECGDYYDYRMLVIESMDADTETRRLSPVALFHPGGYVDLINGPQDHGWCNGYTCQKRLSTFPAIVALDEPFDIFLTSTNPKRIRYMLLNSGPDECVRLGMWYTAPYRLEVEIDGVVKLPKNGYFTDSGAYRLRLPETTYQYMPDVHDKINGEFYVSQDENMIFWVQCGGDSLITVIQSDVLIVSFILPPMNDAEFFGEGLIENLAAFLEVDPKKVRIVNIVSENSKRRRKRQVEGTEYVIEIGDGPGEENTVDYENVAQTIIDEVQLGDISAVLNVTVLYTAIVVPTNDTNSTDSGSPATLVQVGHLVMDTHPMGDNSDENEPLSVQPKFKVTDMNGDVVTFLGSATVPWEIEASIKSSDYENASLVGESIAIFTDGWANFTDLAVSHKGSYILEFNIISPPKATNYSVETVAFTVRGREIEPTAKLVTTERIVASPVVLEIGLANKDDSTALLDIDWANHTWTATAAIYDSTLYPGVLSGNLPITFDSETGVGTFTNLQFSEAGVCPVLVNITTDLKDYVLQMVVFIDVISSDQASINVTQVHSLGFKFLIEYDPVLAPYWTASFRNIYSKTTGMRIVGASHASGSLIITLDIEASTSGYNETLHSLCSDIEDGSTFTFGDNTVAMDSYMTIDGTSDYKAACRIKDDDDKDDDENDLMNKKYIIIISVLAFIIFILIIVLLAYKCYFHPNAQTSDAEHGSNRSFNTRSDLLVDSLEREGTLTSLKSRAFMPPLAPSSTRMSPNKSFDLNITSPTPSSNSGSKILPPGKEGKESPIAWS